MKIITEEASFKLPGELFHCPSLELKGFKVRQVCLSDHSFNEQNFFAQALLPFFIEAATPIEPCHFWRYFLVYTKEEKIVSLITVFEAFQNAEKMRMKIS